MSKHTLRQTSIIIGVIATIAINALAVTLPLAGRDTGEISDSFPVLFTPAGYVFSIWSVIYLALIAYAIYQALPKQKYNDRLQAAAGPFLFSCAFNISWLFAWHYLQINLSLIIMLGILISLIITYQKLEIGQTSVPLAETLTARLAISLYLGWISVATVANTSVFLYNLNWSAFGLSQTTWTIIMISIVTLLCALIIKQRRDAVYSLVIIWAFVGIANKHPDITPLTTTITITTILIALGIIYALISKQRNPAPTTT